MALKKLSQFDHFDIEEFLSKIKLLSTGQTVWKDYVTKNRQGTSVEGVIVADKHTYHTEDGEVINNLYEKLTIKIPKEITVPMNVEIRPVNPKARLYGEYRNMLSITADDIEVVSK